MWRPMVLVLVAALAACSGDDGSGAPAPSGSSATSSTVAGSVTASSAPATTAGSTTTAAVATTSVPPTTSPTTTTTSPTTTTAPATTTTTTTACPGPPFARAPQSSTGATTVPVLLTAVRVARHDCYDRVVFELASAMPEWRVAPAVPPFSGPSAIPVDVRGTSWLHVRFATTDAHTEDGEATVGPRPVPVRDATAIEHVQLIEDFEGVVVFVIGLDRERPFRVQTIADPPRLVIDVRTS